GVRRGSSRAPQKEGHTAIRFGTSGWRAVIAEEFTFANARRVVASIARFLAEEGHQGSLVLVGYDTRFLAKRFASQAAGILEAEGFLAEISSGPVPTPVLAFEIRRRGAVGAVNFTASHNRPQYLGIKFSNADGTPALPETTKRIEQRIARTGEVAEAAALPAATFDPAPAYLADLASKVRREDVARGRPRFA